MKFSHTVLIVAAVVTGANAFVVPQQSKVPTLTFASSTSSSELGMAYLGEGGAIGEVTKDVLSSSKKEESLIALPQQISEEQVRSLFKLLNDALATGDSDAVAKRYSKSAVLFPTTNDDPRVGYKSIKQYFEDFLPMKPRGEVLESSVTIDKDWCKDVGTFLCTMGSDGSKVKARYSLVYVWEDSEWRISHHYSRILPFTAGATNVTKEQMNSPELPPEEPDEVLPDPAAAMEELNERLSARSSMDQANTVVTETMDTANADETLPVPVVYKKKLNKLLSERTSKAMKALNERLCAAAQAKAFVDTSLAANVEEALSDTAVAMEALNDRLSTVTAEAMKALNERLSVTAQAKTTAEEPVVDIKKLVVFNEPGVHVRRVATLNAVKALDEQLSVAAQAKPVVSESPVETLKEKALPNPAVEMEKLNGQLYDATTEAKETLNEQLSEAVIEEPVVDIKKLVVFNEPGVSSRRPYGY